MYKSSNPKKVKMQILDQSTLKGIHACMCVLSWEKTRGYLGFLRGSWPDLPREYPPYRLSTSQPSCKSL